MAKSSFQKLRQRKDKEGNPIVKKCDVCGEPLIVGEQYRSVWNYYHQWDMHCECYHKCPRSRWETSEYRGQVYDIQDAFDRDNIEGTIYDLESLRDELEEKLDNIPEQLRDADAGCTLQERMDAVDEVIDTLNEMNDDIQDIESWEYEDYKEDYETEEDFEDYKEQEIEDRVSEAEDALSNLDI